MKFVIVFILFVASLGVQAQSNEGNEELTWYFNKKEAFDSAQVQNKQVILFWGSNACSVCNSVKKNLAADPLISIVNKNYILWFSDATINNRYSADVSDYLSHVSGSISYPALCIINPSEPTKGKDLKTGYQNISTLTSMLNQYVSNDPIDVSEKYNFAFVSGDYLVVKNNVANETISVYTVMGVLVDHFSKKEQVVERNASSYPSGILIAAGSSGWTQKFVIK